MDVCSSFPLTESCDPPTQGYSDDTDTGLARAVRLSTDTEVVIAPRTRASASATPLEQPEELKFDTPAAAQQGNGNAASTYSTPWAAQQYLHRSPFRVLPSGFRCTTANPSAAAVLHPDDARILATAFGSGVVAEGRCAITKMPCPAAPQVFASAAEASRTGSSTRSTTLHAPEGRDHSSPSTSNNAAPATVSDGGGDAATTSTSVPARATASTYFSAAESVGSSWPRRQVFITEELRGKLGLRDFDLVRFSSPPPIGLSTPSASRPGSPQPQEGVVDQDGEEHPSTAPVLAGYDKVLATCIDTVQNAFRAQRWRAMRVALDGEDDGQLVTFNAGLLLTGSPGSGKTSVARVVADRLATSSSLVATIHIDCTPYAEERVSAMRSLFDRWLASAVWHSPTLLVLDNLDRIAPADQEHVDSPRSAHVAESLMHRIRDVAAQHSVFVLATSQSNMSINKVCIAHHVFGETVELKAPTKEARRDILAHLVALRSHLQPYELNYATIAGQTEGYMPADLRDLVERTVHQSAVRMLANLEEPRAQDAEARALTMADFEEAQKGFTPLSLRDIQLTQSATRWSDIGGLQETRRVLRETLEWPTKYARVFAQCPLRLRSGLLLYGYPGCGKTLLAGAVARECGLNFISVKGPEILNKYIGASEKSVRDLFDRAQAAKPCVLFFDEFDSIAPKRGHDSTGVTDRVVNQLLTQMDGAEGLSGVYVLAATSRPDLIDSALLRPGRLDKSLLCDLPDEAERLDILHVLCGNDRVRLAADVDLEAWAKRTDGFSGADLQALVYNANLEAIHEGMNQIGEMKKDKQGTGQGEQNGSANVRFISFGGQKASKSTTLSGAERQALQRRMELILGNARGEQQGKGQDRRQVEANGVQEKTDGDRSGEDGTDKGTVVVTEAHLQKCLRTTRQSVPRNEQQRLRAIYQQFVGERSGNFPKGEASHEVGARQSLM